MGTEERIPLCKTSVPSVKSVVNVFPSRVIRLFAEVSIHSVAEAITSSVRVPDVNEAARGAGDRDQIALDDLFACAVYWGYRD